MATLYRKYRSKTFGEIIGQEPIVTTLKNQIKLGRIGHAYLFTGSRGIGKTSIARIFARAVNCLHPEDGEPCGKCEACKALEAENVDIIELDAASNNGVDDARDIREKVKYAPVSCKYKVYIIDEAHMLTGGASNALLKTIEEPPEHIIFILATTEPQKLPQTILSRCIRFDFRLVPTDVLTRHICKVYDSEGIRYTPEAAEEIARLGEGSVRDALSIADTLASAAEVVTPELVLSLMGAGDAERIAELFNAVASRDLPAALNGVDGFAKNGKSMPTVCRQLIDHTRNVLVYKSVNGAAERGLINASKAVIDAVAAAAALYSMSDIAHILEELSAAESGLKYSVNPRVFLETTLVRIICGAEERDDILKRIEALEKNSANPAEQKKNKVTAQNAAPELPQNDGQAAVLPQGNAFNEYSDEYIPPPEPPEDRPTGGFARAKKPELKLVPADDGDFGDIGASVPVGKALLGKVASYLRRSGEPQKLRVYELLARGVEVKERSDRIGFVAPESCFLLLGEKSALDILNAALDALGIAKRAKAEQTEDDLFEKDYARAYELFGRDARIIKANNNI